MQMGHESVYCLNRKKCIQANNNAKRQNGIVEKESKLQNNTVLCKVCVISGSLSARLKNDLPASLGTQSVYSQMASHVALYAEFTIATRMKTLEWLFTSV